MFVEPLKKFNINSVRGFSQLEGFSWLDSAEGGRFSLIAVNPVEVIKFDAASSQNDFMDFMGSLSVKNPSGNSPFLFTGGWIGYISYEAFAFNPEIPFAPNKQKPYPLAVFRRYEDALIYDHLQNTLVFVSNRKDAKERLRLFENILNDTSPYPENLCDLTLCDIHQDTSHDEYIGRIQTIKAALAAGDFFQLNLSIEFSAGFSGDPFLLYQNLRRRSPEPYMAFLDFENLKILSASPECFFETSGNRIVSYPIKGTAPRCKDPLTDRLNADHLLSNGKDLSELLMITDLLRNDLGKVCVPGSVITESITELLSLSRCHHLQSRIAGTLRDQVAFSDIFKAVFPGGSITGAPKIKVMQTIQNLEARARGVYTGALGFISHNGRSCFNIPIRTLTVADGIASWSAGSGVVMESEAEKEYAECLLKASTLERAWLPAAALEERRAS